MTQSPHTETMQPARCATCRAPIWWAKSTSGTPVPIEYEPRSDGNIIFVKPGHIQYLRKRDQTDDPRYASHFAFCPDSKFHRRGGR
jgi:hypothetical protein